MPFLLQIELAPTSVQPEKCAPVSLGYGVSIRSAGGAFIEGHDHIGAQVPLNIHDRFGSEEMSRSVDMALEHYAIVSDLIDSCPREDLEASGIRENGSIPPHEGMKPPQLLDQLVARPYEPLPG